LNLNAFLIVAVGGGRRRKCMEELVARSLNKHERESEELCAVRKRERESWLAGSFIKEEMLEQRRQDFN
jgi:hypothetical protein